MADTINQQIIDAIKTRFETIKKAASYNLNLGNNISIWRIAPFKTEDLPAVVIRDIGADPETGTVSRFTWRLNIEVDIILASGADTINEARAAIADIYKAIGTDYRWSGLALRTEQPSHEITHNQDENKTAKVSIKFAVIYQAALWTI